jgi:hypothetical protein
MFFLKTLINTGRTSSKNWHSDDHTKFILMANNINPIDVEILEINDDLLKVKIPFVDIPIEMNRQFFSRRLECGYFNVSNIDTYLSFFSHQGQGLN